MKSILLALISFVICLALELFIIAQKDIFIAIGLMAFWFVILVYVRGSSCVFYGKHGAERYYRGNRIKNYY